MNGQNYTPLTSDLSNIKGPIVSSNLPITTPKKQNRLSLFLLISVIIAIFIAIGIFFLMSNKTLSEIKDSKYGFTIKNIKDWKKIPPRKGVYLSLATAKDNTIISYAGIQPIPKPAQSTELDEVTVKDLCTETTQSKKGINQTFEVTKINEISGFKCSFETIGENIDTVLTINIYTLINDQDNGYNFFITTSNPRDDFGEAQKVNDLISGFTLL